MLAVGPLPVLLPDLCLVGADGLGDLGPGRAGLDGVVDAGGMPVVPGQHFADREDFQVLGDGQRLVLAGVCVPGRVIGAARLERRDTPGRMRSRLVSSSNRSRASMMPRLPPWASQ